jgi:hypothetical protein
MEKAYFYETYGGLIHRCMFAGLDNEGHAKWVNITPDEISETITCDEVKDGDFFEEDKNRYILIAIEGEAAQPYVIAHVLGKVMECPIDFLDTELYKTVQALEALGVTWLKNPQDVSVWVFENGKSKRRHGKYSFFVEDKNRMLSILADIDGFDDLDELFSWIRTYFKTIEKVAKIPIVTKELRIDEGLKKNVSIEDLAMFDMVKIESGKM